MMATKRNGRTGIHRILTLLVVLSLAVPYVVAVDVSPAEATTTSVGTETEFKAALLNLSSDSSGPHSVTLTDNIGLTLGQAEYSGTRDLTIDGNGYSIDGQGHSRVLFFPISEGVTVTLQNLIIENGQSKGGSGGPGAGVLVNEYDPDRTRPGGDLVVINSVVRNNTTGWGNDGGGISVPYGGDLTLIDSMVLSNHAEDSGGVAATNVLVINSTIANNTARSGEQAGGIYGGETVKLINSTVSGNTASYASGIYSRGPVTLIYSTVSGNLGAPNIETSGPDSGLTSFGSVIANPRGVNCLIAGVTDSTYSYDDDGTCGFVNTTDTSNGADPNLGALLHNGGPTRTLLPADLSPLIDQIPSAECDATYDTDQRGISRPQGAYCDIGAVEVFQNSPPVADAGGPYTANEGDSVTFDGSGSLDPDVGDLLTYTWTLTPDDHGFSSASETPSHTFVDDYSGKVELTVADDSGSSDTAISSVTVSNVAPSIDTFTITPTLIAVGGSVAANATFTDPGITDTHTAEWDWGDTTTPQQGPAAGSVNATHVYTAAGVYPVTLTVTDNDDGSDTEVSEFVVVYDPSAGFVTGGGWIDSPAGAYKDDSSLTGKATFGLVSNYKKGASVPTGNTEFQFRAGDLNFRSTSYDWLVVTGSDSANFKGEGTINGEGSYRFKIWAGDGAPDTFRIQIWDEKGIFYDNGSAQAIGGGSIVVHTRKK